MELAKGAVVRPHVIGDEFKPHMRQVMVTSMGDQYTHINACSRLKDTVVYLKEHNCAIIGWIAIGPVEDGGRATVIGAGAIQPGRIGEELAWHAAKQHGAKSLFWAVRNPVHSFLTAQMGFRIEGEAVIYKPSIQ